MLCRTLTLGMLLAALGCAEPLQQKAVPSPGEANIVDKFVDSVQVAAQQLPQPPEEIGGAGRHLVIVFVPGVLGTRLMNGERTIWGVGSPSAASLALPPTGHDHIRPTEVLDKYETFLGEMDVYGAFRTTVKRMLNSDEVVSPLASVSYKEFPYDWRHDIRESAARLDIFLRREGLQGREIVIVAHGLGAVVTWYWQNHYYRQDPDDSLHVLKLLLLGAPLRGTCDVMRMLVYGYYDAPGQGVDPLYTVLFRSVRAAVFTFPSIFQILPRVPASIGDEACIEMPVLASGVWGQGKNDRLAEPCSEVSQESRPAPRVFDYFSVACWEGKSFSEWLLAEPGASSGRLPYDIPEWDGRYGTFCDRLGIVLRKAATFQEDLQLDDSRVSTAFFYSDQHRTTTKIETSWSYDRGGYRLGVRTDRNGDGRVTSASATNDRRQNGSNYDHKKLTARHCGLLIDEVFVAYLRTLLRAYRAGAASRFASENPTLFNLSAAVGSRSRELIAALQELTGTLPTISPAVAELVGMLRNLGNETP